MSQQQSQQSWYDLEEFASMTGFHKGLAQIGAKGGIKLTNTASDLRTGGVHGLRYKVESDAKGAPELRLQHWVHWPDGRAADGKRGPDILVFRTETRQAADGRTEVRPVSADWMGKTYTDAADLTKFMHLLQETSAEIRDNIVKNTEPPASVDSSTFPELQRRTRQTKRRDEIPNLYHIAQRCDIKAPFTLEGMYFNGEFNFGAPAKSAQPPAYPLQLLRPLLALEAEILKHDNKAFANSFTLPNPQAGGYEGVTYAFAPNAANDEFELACKVWSTGKTGQREETQLYRVAFRKEAGSPNMFRLSALEMLGHKPDLADQKGVARALRAMKYIHLAIQRGEAPMFSDIIHEHDLKAFLAQPAPPQETAKAPRTMIQVFGANTDAALSRKEMSIGSNGMIIVRDFMEKGEWVKQGIGIDWGVTFGDGKKEHYHTITQNYGRFVNHAAAPHIKPFVNTIVNLETHEHEDHLRGVARLAKFGFTLPPLVMNRHTQNVLARMMGEERVRKSKIDEVMRNCHLIDFDRYAKPDRAGEKFEYGDTVIEQGYETVPSKEEGVDKYFPVLTVYSKQHPDAKSTVRVGPAGHSARALMFEVDGILYSGDYKLDQTIPANLRSDLDWLAKCRDTSVVHIQESTNASKESPYNATIAEVLANRKKLLAAEKKGRIFYDTIGSNALDIETLCQAAGEVRKEAEEAGEEPPFKHIIFGGAAIRNKYADLNSTDGFKKKMKRLYGIETLHIDSARAKELLAKGGRKAPSYIVVMTGTQDEPLSMSHRVSRDLYDKVRLQAGDIIVRGQAPIPGDNRDAIRREQNNRYRHDFGCKVYDALELAQEGVHIYTSSHASQEDYRTIHAVTGGPLKILHHGGPQQLAKMKQRMDEMGAKSIIPDKQALYEIDRVNKTVKIAGETPEERVGYREIRDDADEFYKKHRQQATVIRVKDRWQGDVAARMYRFEAIVEARENAKLDMGPTSRGANIAADFNAASGADFPPIGINHPDIKRPYYQNHKAIRLFIGEDTETTGASPQIDVHTDIGFVAATPDGKEVARKTLKHALPKYVLPAAGALLVTKNDNPADLYKGLPLRRYVHEMFKVYKDWAHELTGDKAARAAFVGWRNGVFDDPITMRMMGMALAARDMKPMATHGNLQIDGYNFYSALIALMPEKINVTRDKDGNCIRTLRAACLANGVPYDDKASHGALYDATRALELMFKFRDTAPDLFDQMLMNCDFSSSRPSPMLDHILGQDHHVNDQAPVFGYVDMRDRKCTPKLGALVTIDTVASKATDAIVMDLAKADIHALEQLPDNKLLELMNDPNGPFAVIKLNNSPTWFPPNFIYRDPKVRAKAVGNMPKTTLQARANALSRSAPARRRKSATTSSSGCSAFIRARACAARWRHRTTAPPRPRPPRPSAPRTSASSRCSTC
jgi:mRNA degradation ribonuclease J1/J2